MYKRQLEEIPDLCTRYNIHTIIVAIPTLKNLRDLGNTVIVVEHDEDTMRSADYICLLYTSRCV